MTARTLPPYDAIPSAWARLTLEKQAELGCMLIEFELATYASGELWDPRERFGDRAFLDAASDRSSKLLSRFHDVIWPALPDLFGVDGEHPAWAKEAAR